MNLYVESSAVMAWQLLERQATQVRPVFAAAERIVTSDLTPLECDRTLIRLVSLGKLTETEMLDRRLELNAVFATWDFLQIRRDILSRARQPFPNEPIRSLDAIHLASALAARSIMPGLEILSLDQRIRISAGNLGFRVQPQ